MKINFHFNSHRKFLALIKLVNLYLGEMCRSPKQAYSCDTFGAFWVLKFKGNYASYLEK